MKLIPVSRREFKLETIIYHIYGMYDRLNEHINFKYVVMSTFILSKIFFLSFFFIDLEHIVTKNEEIVII